MWQENFIYLFQISPQVILSHEATQDTGFDFCHTSCVLSDGSIIYGYEFAQSYKFYFFTKDGKPTGQKISQLCYDSGFCIKLLSLIITGMEYLAVSCNDCKNIRLINLQDHDQEPIVAYTSQEKVGPMCLGETGTLYTAARKSGVVSVLDCSTTSFILKSRLPEIKNFDATDICFMDRPGLIAVSSCPNSRICAISSDSGIVWDISPQIDDEKVRPRGLVYLPDQDLLLVGDTWCKRMIVVTSNTGYIVQTISVHRTVDDLHLNGSRLIVRTPGRLSIYTVSLMAK